MQYVDHQNLTVYSGDRANWRDIPVTSERPGPDYIPVLEDIPERPYKAHVGWEYQPPPPQPNWEQFNSVAMADPVLNNAIAVTMGIAPLAALSLSATLIKAESGKLTEFETAFNVVVQSAQVPNEAIDDWINIATDNNLPADFIDILEQSKTPLT